MRLVPFLPDYEAMDGTPRWGRSNACGKCGTDTPIVTEGLAILDEAYESHHGPEGFEYDGVA